MEFVYTIGIIISGIAGFLLARYISKTKMKPETHLVCPLGHSCERVVSGRFSRFLGMPVEKMGMVYYSAVALFYILTLFVPIPQNIILYVLLATGASFAFSAYLMITQLLVLKTWCTLCLGSAALSFMILVLSFLGFTESFVEFIFGYRDLLRWLYVGSLIIGTVVTSLHLRSFIKFLKDFTISKRESSRLIMFSQTAWFAIGLALLSGIGLVLTDQYNEITGSSKFIVMVVITGILVIYEVVVNMFVAPDLIDIHFGDKPALDDHEHSYKRKIAFAFSGVGVASWYMLLLLGTFSLWKYSSGFLFIMYLVLVLVAAVLSILAENIFYKKSILDKQDKNKK